MLGDIHEGTLHTGYEPHGPQQEIHACGARFRICVCGRRFGKTLLALNELFKNAWESPDKLARCWYVAPNYRQAKTVAWEMLKEIVPEQLIAQINEAELLMRLVNGRVIELKGAESPDSLRGAKLYFVVLDEYATMRASVWDEIIRPAMADVPGSRAIFIGTPNGYNHFKTLYDKGLGGDTNYQSFRFGTADNPYVPKEEIEEIQVRTNPTIFRQEYEASFEQLSGCIYPMFSRQIHVVDPRPIPAEWERVMAMDWGMRNPSAVLFAAMDPSGVMWIYDLLYDSGKTVSQWAGIFNARADREQVLSWVIDPSAIAQAREFGQYGIYFHSYNQESTKRLNDVTIGINLVSQWLLEGRIKMFKHCEVLANQMECYQWDPSKPKFDADSAPKPLKKDDHAVDALRYLCMARPMATKIDHKKHAYKKLDGASEMFWRSHFNDFPSHARELMPSDCIDLLSGLDNDK